MKVEVAGVPIHVEETGQGPCVILVHCGASSHRQWAHLAACLMPHHRVLMPDLFSHGGTPDLPTRDAYRLDIEAEIVGAVLAAVGGTADIVGHSYGGALAAWWALHHPEGIGRLVLIEPTLFGVLPPGSAEVHTAETWLRPILEPMQSGDVEPACRAFFDALLGPDAWGMLPETRRVHIRHQMAVSLAPATVAQADARVHAARWEDLRVPTTLIQGEITADAWKHTVAALAARLPHAAPVVTVGGGHMAPLTHSNEVANAVLQALTLPLT